MFLFTPAHPKRISAALAVVAMSLGLAARGCDGATACDTDDGDPCTVDACKDGVATHAYLGDEHPCFVGKLSGVCMGGECQIACKAAADCEENRPCMEHACIGERCVLLPDKGTSAPSDGNPCTIDGCIGDEPVSWPAPDGMPPKGQTCGQVPGLENGEPIAVECLDGLCAFCRVSSDCGETTECTDWACEAHVCRPKYQPLGHGVLSGSVPGDCGAWICDGHGRMIEVPDSTDTRKENVPCHVWECDGHTPVLIPVFRASCALPGNIEGLCDELGKCQQCLKDSDCFQADEWCYQNVCVSCSNGIQDGDEIGVDCGGTCGDCLGTPCILHKSCATFNCAYTNVLQPDRVCCDLPCDGLCEQCGLDGKCVAVPNGQQDKITCSFLDKACFNQQCKTKNGFSCNYSAECISGFCDPTTKTCKAGN